MSLENTILLRVGNDRNMNPSEGGRKERWYRPSEQGGPGCVQRLAAVVCAILYRPSNHQRSPSPVNSPSSQKKQTEHSLLQVLRVWSNKPIPVKRKSNMFWEGMAPLTLREHRQEWPQRDHIISFPSGIPSWNCLEPRCLTRTDNCSGVQFFLRWLSHDFESQHLTKHILTSCKVPNYNTLQRCLKTQFPKTALSRSLFSEGTQNRI